MPTGYATRRAFTFIHLLIVLGIVFGVLLCLLVPAILKSREEARALICQARMNKLNYAMGGYQREYGHFPAAYQNGTDGSAWHSWRLEILPALDWNGSYQSYQFNEPWNGPKNRLLASQVDLEIFQCLSGSDFQQTLMTNYAALTGPQTIFPGLRMTKPDDIIDGLANTIMLVETHDGAIHWMKPRDVRVSGKKVPFNGSSTPSISSPHSAGPVVAFADGSCRRLSLSISPKVLYELSTIAGGEATTQDSLPLNNE